MAVSAAVDLAVIAALGAPPLAVLGFHLLHAGFGLAQHANARIPARADRVLRRLVATPDFHRVHHSAELPETDRNFAALLTLWDAAFGTWLDQPARGSVGMRVGLDEVDPAAAASLGQALLHPLRSTRPAASAAEAA
jgi:sterol desaturase/sphingolipid hydroxylase (fatty acid hydroxylase superfamily)